MPTRVVLTVAWHAHVLGALAQQLYQTMSMQGLGGLDFSAIIKLYGSEDA